MHNYPGVPQKTAKAVSPLSKRGFGSSPSLRRPCTDGLRLSRNRRGGSRSSSAFSNAFQRHLVLKHPHFLGSKYFQLKTKAKPAGLHKDLQLVIMLMMIFFLLQLSFPYKVGILHFFNPGKCKGFFRDI